MPDLPPSSTLGMAGELGADGEPDAGPLAGELRVAVMRLTRQIKSRRATDTLPERCFSVLFALAAHGPMTPGALASREHVRPPSMTRTIAHLQDLGLLTRTAHPLDGRQAVIALTDTGRAHVRETSRRHDEWLASRLARLTQDERDVLARAAGILGRLTD